MTFALFTPNHAVASSAVAHQRKKREEFMIEEPRQPVRSLDGYTVELISRAAAQPIILKYEWLGTMGQTSTFVGLFSPARELEGVVCFGMGPQGDTRRIVGEPALCLERGACVHYAPPNAASFLITHACKLVHRLNGVAIFYAYADPEAGEYGAVYQAANWTYLGQGLKNGKERPKRTMVLPPEKDPKNPAELAHHPASARAAPRAPIDLRRGPTTGLADRLPRGQAPVRHQPRKGPQAMAEIHRGAALSSASARSERHAAALNRLRTSRPMRPRRRSDLRAIPARARRPLTPRIIGICGRRRCPFPGAF